MKISTQYVINNTTSSISKRHG